MKTGLEVFLEAIPTWAKGRRIGLLCHQASVAHGYVHAKDLFRASLPEGRFVCIFSPQHGFYADKQDNMVESADEVDPRTGLPVFSLYGTTRSLTEDHLSQIDLFVVDLQDVGCRVYTYVWTMYLAMKACARAGKGVAVLDRPNPLGGEAMEGNLLSEECFSFVGMAPIPMRHGMTMGELALFLKEWGGLDVELHVVKMEGWKRDMYFDHTGLPWVWPSPNMPTLDTVLVYPGQVVLEGTNVSEGRGTTRPFEVFGAPYLDEVRLKRDMEAAGLDGFVLRQQHFRPTFHKWEGERCRGLQIHVTDRTRFKPYLAGLLAVSRAAANHPRDFSWKAPPYEYEYERLPADLIIGDVNVRKAVEQGAMPGELEAIWAGDLDAFREARGPFLLYG